MLLVSSTTLAVPTPNKTNSFDLVKVPQEDRDSILIELEKVGILKPGDKQKVTEQLGKETLQQVSKSVSSRSAWHCVQKASKDTQSEGILDKVAFFPAS